MALILVVEDDPAIAGSLQDALAREGYSVEHRSAIAAGLDAVRTLHPQLILLDVRLPDGSGFDFCRQVRSAGHRQPIIMLTVQRTETDKVLGLEMGADDYLTKPFNLRELFARIRAQLRRAYGEYAAAEAHVRTIGEVTLDLNRAEAFRRGDPLRLTPTEYRLLAYLEEHRGMARSRAQIVEAVWGYTGGPDDERAVNVHIRRLREKIELDPGRPALIMTVPGIGYRLAG